MFPHNALVLSIFGFLFSLPCFQIAVSRPQYISASRFVLLTYNLTCLYWCVLSSVRLGRYQHLSDAEVTISVKEIFLST